MSHWLPILALTIMLSACSDSGVSVTPSEAGGSNTAGGSSTGGSAGGGTGGTTGAAPSTTASANLDPDDIAAARFLNQATFGTTESSIAEFKTFDDANAWIEHQFTLPMSTTLSYTQENSNGSHADARHEAWWNNALDEPDQLRQRMAFALSQIFVVSDLDYALSNAQYGMSDYYDMLSRNAFGNYRTLLEDVTLHPVMGVYLSMARNEKANPELKIRPDENYAREALQLFSVGLTELNMRGEPTPEDSPNRTYDQNTIEEFARVYTGWDYPLSRFWGDTNTTDMSFVGRMKAEPTYHDQGSKTLLNGTVLPAGLTAEEDMQAALDNIFQHQNVAPFISKQLIQRLVTSDPSPEYVERVANVFADNGNAVRGDLKAVVKTILLDDEARNGHIDNAEFGKIKEPVIKLAHYWRALKATPGPEANGVHNTADFVLSRLDEMSGQAVMRSKSVFNFYRPDYQLQAGNEQLAPEMQIMSEAFLAATHNNYHHLVYRFHNRADLTDDNPAVTITNLEPLATLSANPDELLDWYNLIFFAGSMPDAMRESLKSYMNSLPSDDAGRFARAQDSLFMITTSPALHIQR